MKRLILTLILSFPLLLNAWADWKAVSNQHFRIYYKDNWEAEAVKVLQTLEHYRPALEEMTGGSLGRIPFTIEDLGNIVNGYTDIYGTRIALFAYPPTSGELAVGEDWWTLVACHEYLHMLQMTRASGTPQLLRLLFGNLFYPHMWQPGWMTEGITIYGESQLSPYSGRLNGGTYPSIIATLAKKDKLPSPTKASYYSFDTPHASHYTYGGAFYDYLTQTYGEDKLAELFGYTSSSIWSYSSILLPNLHLDKSFRLTFGKNVSDLWADWQNYERAKPCALPEQALTYNGWFKSNLQYHNGRIWYLERKADKTGPSSSFSSFKLRSLDLPQTSDLDFDKSPPALLKTKVTPRTVIEQNSDFPAGYHFIGNELYYTRSEYAKDFKNSEMDGWGSQIQLWKMQLSTAKREKIYTGQVRAFRPLQDGSILLAEDDLTHTRSTLYKYVPATKSKTVIYSAPGLISSIHEYKEKLILGLKEPWRNLSIYVLEPGSGRLQDLLNSPYYAVPVSVKGDSLVFNAVFEGCYGAYLMNLQTGNLYRLTHYTDVRTPVLASGSRTYFISISDSGYDIYKSHASQTLTQLPEETVSATTRNASPGLTTASTSYTKQSAQSAYLSNIGHLLLPRILHIPVISGTEQNMDIGALLAGNDAVGDFPLWMAQVIYNTKMRRLLYDISLSNNFFRPVKQVLSYSNYTSALTDPDMLTNEPNHTLEQSLFSQQYVELYKSRNYGLTNVLAGFSLERKDDSGRTIWMPFVSLNLSWAATRLALSQFLPWETSSFLPSDRERTGWQSQIRLHQKMPVSSEIRVLAQLADDAKADSTEVFGSLRGYDSDFDVNRGALIRATWYKPVFKIREGIWSPQVYLEDVNLGLFYDLALPFTQDDAQKQYSYGVEVLAELGLAYNFMLNAGVRFSRNREDKYKVDFLISSLF